MATQNADTLFLAGQNFCLVMEQSNLSTTDFFFIVLHRMRFFSVSLSDRDSGRSFYRFYISPANDFLLVGASQDDFFL
ncbi:MAG: hypothetical protein F6K54_08790 [Okeania sp. SIO3B5]|uniref:hypothetical protein n=1 Tax=Okeania sp. SIO3B5 TaxID=2607811 RepID=UPI001400D0B6|nr:hypothetical protein [Okeania sp. SIO3B5]NEO53168.1 hypothetical protein [Okeania sp. SIO3B5]